MRRFKLVGLVFAALLAAAPAVAEKKVALVVGVDDYPNFPADMQLERAVADAEAIGDALQALGFRVTRLTEGVSQELFLRRFGEFLSGIERGDTALFFFAGHGVGIDGTNYLIPADVPRITDGNERLVKSRSLSETDLIADIRDRGARVTVMVIDACRNNPFPRAGTRSLGLQRGLAVKPPAEGVFSIYSAGLGQQALDRLGDGDRSRNSVFTRVFVEQLRRPGISLIDLGENVREEVKAIADTVAHPQVPAYYNEVTGARSVFLAGRGTDAPPAVAERPRPAPLPAPVLPPAVERPRPSPPADDFAREKALWEAAQAQNSVLGYQSYLQRFPDGTFSGVARGAIAKLTAPPRAEPAPRVEAAPPPNRGEPAPPPAWSPPPGPVAALPAAAGFIFPDSDRRPLSPAEVARLSPAQARIARNEIFARRGRFFQDPALTAHFRRFAWYRPFTWDPPLNAVEKANASLIQAYER